jgi:ribonuclease R
MEEVPMHTDANHDPGESSVRRDRILEALRDPACRHMLAQELAIWLDVPETERDAFFALLAALETEGLVVRSRKNRYALAEQLGMKKGKFSANARGFGFIAPEGSGTDLFVPAEDTLGAMDGDVVLYKVIGSAYSDTGRREAVVTRVVERAHNRVVGTFTALARGGFVTPDARRVFEDVRIPEGRTMDARDGQKVVVSLTRWPDGAQAAEGEVLVVLGAQTDPGVDVLSVLWQNGIPVAFSEAALAQAKRLPEVPEPADYAGRRDLRNC